MKTGLSRSVGAGCLGAFCVLFVVYNGPLVIGNAGLTAIIGLVLVSGFMLLSSQGCDVFELFNPTLLSSCGSVLCIIGCVLCLVEGSLPMMAGAVLAALGACLSLIVQVKMLGPCDRHIQARFVDCAFALCAAFVALGVLLPYQNGIIPLVALPAIIPIHTLLCKPMEGTVKPLSLAEAKKSFSFSSTSLITTGVTGFMWGAGLAMLFFTGANEILAGMCFAVPVFASGVIAILDLEVIKKITEGSMLNVFALFAFAPLACYPWVPTEWQVVLGGIVLLLFTLHTLMCFLAIAEVARFNQLPATWVFGVSLAPYFVGAFIGILVFGCLCPILSTEGVTIACDVSFFAILVLSSFIFKDNYPTEKPVEPEEVQAKAAHKPAVWRKKTEIIISQYKLTARQQEVFRMLLKGRNAQYIADEFVISYSTAKAHIHNIYTKLGVHSQQELISLVENAQDDSASLVSE